MTLLPFPFSSLGCFFWCGYKLENIFSEPITQILGVPEGDVVAGEIFINQGSTINITCIGTYSPEYRYITCINLCIHLSTVRNLPEKSSMYWTHNNEVRRVAVMFYELTEDKEGKYFVSKHKSLLFVCSVPVGGRRGEPLIEIHCNSRSDA